MSRMAPLLLDTLNRMDSAGSDADRMAVVQAAGGTITGPIAARGAPASALHLPLVLQLPRVMPQAGESWLAYRARVRQVLESPRRKLNDILGLTAEPLIAANGLAVSVRVDQIAALETLLDDIDLVQLDALVQAALMDQALVDIGYPVLRQNRPELDGRGVRVAVLDSGIDLQQPFLNVTESAYTTDEPDTIAGDHGTHCAGSIASLDTVFPGVAPGVDLINIKVLRANGSGQSTWIERGVDRALDAGAQVLSMSLGFNHLPTWYANGHGWDCANGDCSLCLAVDNASLLENVVCVVAAGNEHDAAEALRRYGYSDSFDTELACPGQAREAITVGALTKQLDGREPLLAGFSSRGPTAYGTVKPDLAAPGVNITSTIAAPPGEPDPPRNALFAPKSGTSMATPIVAGAVALIIQQQTQDGINWTVGTVRDALLNDNALAVPGLEPFDVGQGRLELSNL